MCHVMGTKLHNRSNFVTKRHRLTQVRVTAIFYSTGVILIGFSHGSVSGYVLKKPTDAINIDMDSPNFTLKHPTDITSSNLGVLSISMSKFDAFTDSVKILVQYCDKVVIHSVPID